jgi:hypothetical protein
LALVGWDCCLWGDDLTEKGNVDMAFLRWDRSTTFGHGTKLLGLGSWVFSFYFVTILEGLPFGAKIATRDNGIEFAGLHEPSAALTILLCSCVCVITKSSAKVSQATQYCVQKDMFKVRRYETRQLLFQIVISQCLPKAPQILDLRNAALSPFR